jgi:hypothetical protein
MICEALDIIFKSQMLRLKMYFLIKGLFQTLYTLFLYSSHTEYTLKVMLYV